jgi:hypothetical protein
VRKRICWFCLYIVFILLEIGCVVNYLTDEARERYVEEKMTIVELMEEDTSMWSQ